MKREKIPARTYAQRHKLSLFQVIKKINTGELEGEVTEENGRKVQYVLVEEKPSSPPGEEFRKEAPVAQTSEASQDALLLELKQLRIEVARLRQMVEKCCAEKR